MKQTSRAEKQQLTELVQLEINRGFLQFEQDENQA